MGDNNLQFEIISSNKKNYRFWNQILQVAIRDLCQDLIRILQNIHLLQQLKRLEPIRHCENKVNRSKSIIKLIKLCTGLQWKISSIYFMATIPLINHWYLNPQKYFFAARSQQSLLFCPMNTGPVQFGERNLIIFWFVCPSVSCQFLSYLLVFLKLDI